MTLLPKSDRRPRRSLDFNRVPSIVEKSLSPDRDEVCDLAMSVVQLDAVGASQTSSSRGSLLTTSDMAN